MTIARVLLTVFGLLVLVVVLYVAGAWLHLYGEHEGPGMPTQAAVPESVVDEYTKAQRSAATSLGVTEDRQILFGDLHVHTTFSTDAFLWSLPMLQGEGAHPIADACDYARFCSGLDFWSINDHAEASTPQRWRETREAIRQCNAIAGDPAHPDVVAFLGWEWSQVGATAEEHYGHKNVIFRDLADDRVPARAIGAAGIATDGLRNAVGAMSPLAGLIDFSDRQRYYNFVTFMDEVAEVPGCPRGVASPDLPPDCYESAATPGELFEKLGQWGFETLVIPHGNTWGFYSPPGTTWDKQLTRAQHDPDMQVLVEVMSGHGNSEEYRDWRAVRWHEDGQPYCPEPRDDYLPSCWRAGELAEARCREQGRDAADCTEAAEAARQYYAELGAAGNLVVPGASVEDWLDAGQCRDCFLPSFNYRPGGSSQYALAIRNFDAPENLQRFRFGFIASSDNHSARPGTGYKEIDRLSTTEARGYRDEAWRERGMRARREFELPPMEEARQDIEAAQQEIASLGFMALEVERQASFFTTGGLAAVHAEGRSREAVWEALEQKRVYGTSGDRILLWFDLINAGDDDGNPISVAMGGSATLDRNPRFAVRAVGAFEQKPGCPEHSTSALSADRLQRLCSGECYNPSDRRKPITRIEVVRIRPQAHPDEPVRSRIEDPWRVFSCDPDPAGCAVEFEDPDFRAVGRDTVYYVRAMEPPSPVVNGDNLRCEYDESGRCIDVDPCYGDYRTPAEDDCRAALEERAWSSPIFVDARP